MARISRRALLLSSLFGVASTSEVSAQFVPGKNVACTPVPPPPPPPPPTSTPLFGTFSGNETPHIAAVTTLLGQAPTIGMDFISYGANNNVYGWKSFQTDLGALLAGWAGFTGTLVISMPLTISGPPAGTTAGASLLAIYGGKSGICLSQSSSGGALTLNGVLAAGGTAVLDSAATTVAVSSPHNISGVTFTINVTDSTASTYNYTVTGVNNNTVYCTANTNIPLTVNSVTASAACTGVSVGPGYPGYSGAPLYQDVPVTSDQAFITACTTLVAAGFGNAIIRVAWEPNETGLGPWCPTGPTGRNSYSAFISAWNYVIPLLKATPGSSFRIMWCPALAEVNGVPTTTFYPGPANVDIIAGDLYFTNYASANDTPSLVWMNGMLGYDPITGGPQPPNTTSYAASWLVSFAAQQNKPTMICEGGSGYAIPVPPNWVATGYNAGMGDNLLFVPLLYNWMVANSVLGICGWWNVSEGGFDGSVTDVSTITGMDPPSPTSNNILLAATIRQYFGNPAAPPLSTGTASSNPGAPIVTWNGNAPGGVIPSGTAQYTVVGQITATNPSAQRIEYRCWTATPLVNVNNYGYPGQPGTAGSIYTIENPSVAHAAATLTFSVQNDIITNFGTAVLSCV